MWWKLKHCPFICYQICISSLYKNILQYAPQICSFFCVYVSTSLLVFLFMEACLERAVPSQSAQSSELWGNWRVVRGWSLRLIIRCFYGELPDFTKISAKGGNTGALQAPGLTPALVITLINNHDQCFWWMGLNLLLMTGGVWGRRRWGRGGTRGAEARRTGVKWTVLLHCEPTLFLSVGNLSPHVLVCVCFCVRTVHTMRNVFESLTWLCVYF